MAVRISRILQQYNNGFKEELRKIIVTVIILTSEADEKGSSFNAATKARGM